MLDQKYGRVWVLPPVTSQFLFQMAALMYAARLRSRSDVLEDMPVTLETDWRVIEEDGENMFAFRATIDDGNAVPLKLTFCSAESELAQALPVNTAHC